ncbi:MAG: hypothetical protein OEX77_01185 [Candidatus Bathyarchaeota archaeon]|nr:hypothetical protein [Candidatus Bathyarchaeota archaeon]MDH5732741.1 hypothetical protein [Candidatus Bathyarchaeota archaeon]
MNKKTVAEMMLIPLFVTIFVATSNVMLVKADSSSQLPVFRLLAIEQMFNNHRMRSAQILIQELLQYPNWNNITGVSYIHLLSLYDYSEVDPDLRPFWKGTLSDKIVKNEIINFLGNASPGEIAILYFCGHSRTSIRPPPLHSEFMGISPSDLRNWLNSTIPQAYLTLILDTCYSGYWLDFSPKSTVLAACGREQAAWGGDIGIFTHGLVQGFFRTDDSNDDGWISAKEVFRYAKNFTEPIVTWDEQNPESYYGAVQGDLPLIQRGITKPFPTWDVTISSMLANPLQVEPESPVTVNLIVGNQGVKYANCEVNIYANSSTISTQQIELLPGETENITFVWFPMNVYGPYVLSSMVSICPGEMNRSNNICCGPKVMVILKADINSDGKVRIDDLLVAAEAFGSYLGHVRWNPAADLTRDAQIRVDDMLAIALDFGKTF